MHSPQLTVIVGCAEVSEDEDAVEHNGEVCGEDNSDAGATSAKGSSVPLRPPPPPHSSRLQRCCWQTS